MSGNISNMIVKLQSGLLDSTQSLNNSDAPHQIDKKAMLVYCGNFESMDGFVEVKEEHINKLLEKRNSLLSKATRMMNGDVPVSYHPPIQLDHSLSAKDTVGRLVGDFQVGEHVSDDGQKVKALFSVLRFMGKENVERVIDGRWLHLSIGADLETGDFKEITITPFPAAANAMLLSKNKVNMATKTEKHEGKSYKITQGPGVSWYLEIEDIKRGPFQSENDAVLAAKQIIDSGVLNKFTQGGKMFERLKAYLMQTQKLTSEDAHKKLTEMPENEKKMMEDEEKMKHEKMRKYLMDTKKMMEKDADEMLAGMDMNKIKELMDEVDNYEKMMKVEQDQKMSEEKGSEQAAQERNKKVMNMSKVKEDITRLSSDFRAKQDSFRLATNKSKITTRLSKLRSEAKITPAEIKKIDLTRLSAANDETIDAVLKTYESREPVIITDIFGSKSSTSTSQVYKQARMSKLEAEIRANMPLLQKTAPQRLNEMPKGYESSPANIHIDVMPEEMNKEIEEIYAMMDKDSKMAKDMLMKYMTKYMKHMNNGNMDHEYMMDQDKHMKEMEDSMKHMQAKFDELSSIASTLVQ